MLVPTGGVRHPTEFGEITEAEYMARRLREAGVPDEAILLENEARTTIENMIYGMLALERYGKQGRPFSAYVVTSAWAHEAQSGACALLPPTHGAHSLALRPQPSYGGRDLAARRRRHPPVCRARSAPAPEVFHHRGDPRHRVLKVGKVRVFFGSSCMTVGSV